MLREAPNNAGMLDHLLDLHRQTLRLVPLAGKAAFLKRWHELELGEADIRRWDRRGVNWGIITGEPLVVIDTDTDEAEAWVKAKGIDSPVIVQSGGGGKHRYFLAPEGSEVHGKSGLHGIKGLDVKGWHGYIVAAGSIHPDTKRRYAYLPGKELRDLHALPRLDPAWVKEERRFVLLPNLLSCAVGGRIQDVRAYIRKIPSIQGQYGSNACYKVAALLYEAGYSDVEAFAEMEAWNEECAFPLWSRAELAKKVRDVWRKKIQAVLG